MHKSKTMSDRPPPYDAHEREASDDGLDGRSYPRENSSSTTAGSVRSRRSPKSEQNSRHVHGNLASVSDAPSNVDSTEDMPETGDSQLVGVQSVPEDEIGNRPFEPPSGELTDDETESDRGHESVASVDDAGPDSESTLLSAIEAILFVSDRPLGVREIAKVVRLDRRRVSELLLVLSEHYRDRGIRLDEIADGFAFRSSDGAAEYVRRFLEQKPVRLSRAQLETLAIVAYRQPITRPEVDDIRGVDSGPVLKGLLERDLVRILGKKDEPGRPLLYGTTTAFLELFGLGSLAQLPTLKEFTELSDDSRRTFEEEIGQNAPSDLAGLGLDLGEPRADTESPAGEAGTAQLDSGKEPTSLPIGTPARVSGAPEIPIDNSDREEGDMHEATEFEHADGDDVDEDDELDEDDDSDDDDSDDDEDDDDDDDDEE